MTPLPPSGGGSGDAPRKSGDGGQTPPEPSLFTTQEVAVILRVSIRTVRDLAAHGELPAYKVGRQWRFPVEGVGSYLKRQKYSLGIGNKDD